MTNLTRVFALSVIPLAAFMLAADSVETDTTGVWASITGVGTQYCTKLGGDASTLQSVDVLPAPHRYRVTCVDPATAQTKVIPFSAYFDLKPATSGLIELRPEVVTVSGDPRDRRYADSLCREIDERYKAGTVKDVGQAHYRIVCERSGSGDATLAPFSGFVRTVIAANAGR
jgi:hypothetical protein